ncbi:MAG: response regulator [Candidatus Dadabacteria bacterium]
MIVHIDDDDDDRIWVKTLMDDLYPSVGLKQFAGGEEALSYLEKVNRIDQPSLILLDINMPKMDGRMLLKAIQANDKLSAIPVILFTTSNSELDKSFARKYNVQLVTKPPTASFLKAALKEIMEPFV